MRQYYLTTLRGLLFKISWKYWLCRFLNLKKRVEIWRSRMTNTPKRQIVQSQISTKMLQKIRFNNDYGLTVSWSDKGNSAGMVNRRLKSPTFPIPATVAQSKGQRNKPQYIDEGPTAIPTRKVINIIIKNIKRHPLKSNLFSSQSVSELKVL